MQGNYGKHEAGPSVQTFLTTSSVHTIMVCLSLAQHQAFCGPHQSSRVGMGGLWQLGLQRLVAPRCHITSRIC